MWCLRYHPGAVVHAISQYSKDPALTAALLEAEVLSQDPSTRFVDAFYTAFRAQAPEVPLHTLFSHMNNRDKMRPDASDDEVLIVLEEAFGRCGGSLF